MSLEIRGTLAQRDSKYILVFHPAWGYFADEFGLVQIPVEIEGKEPTAAELAQVIDFANARGIRTVFVQPQFSTRAAEAVARSIGGNVVPIDPLAEDYVTNMKRVARALIGRPGGDG